MKNNIFTAGSTKITEIISSEILIKNTDDALDIMANVDTDHVVLYEDNFEKDMFDLSNKKLGEILQKFTNYRVSLAIIGDYTKFSSNALKDFIYESNKHGKYLFVSSLDDVKRIWRS